MEAKFSLTPDKLGEIDVKLSIHKGQVAATLPLKHSSVKKH